MVPFFLYLGISHKSHVEILTLNKANAIKDTQSFTYQKHKIECVQHVLDQIEAATAVRVISFPFGRFILRHIATVCTVPYITTSRSAQLNFR